MPDGGDLHRAMFVYPCPPYVLAVTEDLDKCRGLYHDITTLYSQCIDNCTPDKNVRLLQLFHRKESLTTTIRRPPVDML